MGPNRRFQFNIQTLLIAALAFALGMIASNIASGLHPFAIRASMPSSTTPVQPGDWIAIESTSHPEYSQRVRVLADDTIAVKGIGTIRVGGQTINQIEGRIKDRYRTLLQESSVFEVFRGDAFQGQR